MESAVKAEAKEGVVVFSDIAFCTLFVRILDDAEVEVTLLVEPNPKPSGKLGGGGSGSAVDILARVHF